MIMFYKIVARWRIAPIHDEDVIIMGFWEHKRVLVTGGSGFLGTHVVKALKEKGCRDIFVPRKKDYDLTQKENIVKLFSDFHPDIVIHLAAKVGGIGANREKPGEFFYDNMVMGVELMEQARLRNVEKFMTVGTVCSYPKFTKTTGRMPRPSGRG